MNGWVPMTGYISFRCNKRTISLDIKAHSGQTNINQKNRKNDTGRVLKWWTALVDYYSLKFFGCWAHYDYEAQWCSVEQRATLVDFSSHIKIAFIDNLPVSAVTCGGKVLSGSSTCNLKIFECMTNYYEAL